MLNQTPSSPSDARELWLRIYRCEIGHEWSVQIIIQNNTTGGVCYIKMADVQTLALITNSELETKYARFMRTQSQRGRCN